MAKLSLPLTHLIHENLATVMNFAFARRPLETLLETKFEGEWKYLRETLLEAPERRAGKACVELALFLRLLDDEEGLSRYAEETGNLFFGRLIKANNCERRLTLRDVSNKIIHASSLEWNFSAAPMLICNSQEPERWIRAEIDIVGLAAFCGQLMS